jgi:hypothetical protein
MEDKTPTSNLFFEKINCGSINFAGCPIVLLLIIA